MYRTPLGERILVGAERRLFEESLGMMVDHLSDGDWESELSQFDELQRGQKLFALYRVARALLVPDEPPPVLTSFIEATVAVVYRHALDMLIEEIEMPDFAKQDVTWRKLVCEAARQDDGIEEVPDEASTNKADWELILECLEDKVLWDSDFEAQDGLDASPTSVAM